MLKLLSKIPKVIQQTALMYLLAIFIFGSFRLILFLTELGRLNSSSSIYDIFYSFVIGIRFDIVISGYILAVPFALLSILSFFKIENKILINSIKYLIIIGFSLAFLVCAIDIPFFHQFFSRFSISAFEWIDSPEFVFKMITQEPRYWIYIIPFIIFLMIYIKLINRIFSNPYSHASTNIFIKIGLTMVVIPIIFLGIRGRYEEKSPIKVGTAYFCNNAFLNQLGLNPNFTLMRSYLDSQKEENKKVKLLPDDVAIKNVQNYLNINIPNPVLPLARNVTFSDSNQTKYNVILVVMESMAAAKMSRHGHPDNLTPFLDSISNKGYYFENTYTSGIHTMNGVFSTFFSLPALFRLHPMKESSVMKYHGIFSTLKEHNYSTIYFTTHDGQFDNVEGFLKANDCETTITKSDYPSEKIKTTLGVPDDYMFEFSMPILNNLSQKKKPFVAAFMTASDHGPWYIPEYFTPKTNELKKQSVEFADYSLRKFINLAEKQEWFKNTIFVFIADHGAPMDGTYEVPITYCHAPLLFFAPDIIKEHKTFKDLAGQIDVFPTIMGLLKLPYVNNTLGIDLFREKRDYIYFNFDDKFGVIDHNWFLVSKADDKVCLYKYKSKDTYDYSKEYPEIAKKMNIYAKSNLQAYQYIILNNKQ